MSIKDDLLEQVMRAKDKHWVNCDDNSHRYTDSWLYYTAKRPLNMTPPAEGEDEVLTEYVEPVMMNAVSAITPQILDIFTENDQSAVAFRDESFRVNPVIEELVNQTVNDTILKENDGYKTLENALKEALVTGDCFSKVAIEENHKEQDLVLNDWSSMEDVIAKLSDQGWKTDFPLDMIGDEDNGIKPKASGEEGGIQWRTNKTTTTTPEGVQVPSQVIEIMGTLNIYKIDKKIIIDNVGLKDLIIDTRCGDDFSKCRYICHKMNMTVGEAMSMGYKKASLRSASTATRLGEAPYNKFNLVSNSQIGADQNWEDDSGDELERMITIYEHYIYSSIPSKGKESKLYEVRTTDTELLEYFEVNEIPFVHGQMETIPDSFWGRSLYDICKPFQDSESTMQRIAIKNMVNAAYNKLLVVDGQFDAESVINSEAPGAILVQKQQGGITPFPYVDLPQSYGIAMEKFNTTRQETVGRLAGSITTPEGAPDNLAASTVSMILAQEGLKSKVVAKTFARTYVKPLYEKVYSVIKNNGMTITLPAGTKFNNMPQPLPQDETITTDQFPSLYSFVVDINTKGDTAIENQQLGTVVTMMAQVPSNSMVTDVTKFKVAKKLLDSVNLNVDDYFDDPSQRQPDAEAQQLQAFQQEMAKIQLQGLVATVAKTTAETAAIEAKMGNDIESHQINSQVNLTESTAKIQKMLSDAKTAQDKLQLDSVAIGAEIAQGQKDITLKNANTLINAHKAINGVRV